MNYEAKCSRCGSLSNDPLDFRCPLCGSPLEICPKEDFESAKILKSDYSIWRYRQFFPRIEETDIVTLGEGWTPTVRLTENVHFQLESLNPTGSFKDRGSSALISTLHRLVKKRRGYISEDSSGNAGASIAAYAARAALKAKIYVPETVAGPKYNQIRSYGAETVKVPGARTKVTEEAQKTENGKFYVGHVLHPLFRDGIRSLAYEIAENSDWNVPEYVFLPVSAGTLLLGVISGFTHMLKSNAIDSMPTIVACQTRQVSPLYHLFNNLDYAPPKKVTSIADALVSVNPPLLELMCKDLKDIHGDSVLVEEEETAEAYNELATKGFYVEPSSAVAYAGYKKQSMKGVLTKNPAIVVVLTGTGLKTTLKR